MEFDVQQHIPNHEKTRTSCVSYWREDRHLKDLEQFDAPSQNCCRAWKNSIRIRMINRRLNQLHLLLKVSAKKYDDIMYEFGIVPWFVNEDTGGFSVASSELSAFNVIGPKAL